MARDWQREAEQASGFLVGGLSANTYGTGDHKGIVSASMVGHLKCHLRKDRMRLIL